MNLNNKLLEPFKDLGIKEDNIQGLLNNILEGDYVIHMIDTLVYLYLKHLEGYIGRYQGLNTLLGILFGNRMLYSDNGKWSITLNNKLIYQGDDANYDASLIN